MLHTYRDLIVWQKSIELVTEIYLITKNFPKEEIYVLGVQMRRAAISIPSNIAEGRLRRSRKEFRQFLLTAYSSGGELETQIIIAKRLPLMNNLDYSKADMILEEVMKMLNRLIHSIPNA